MTTAKDLPKSKLINIIDNLLECGILSEDMLTMPNSKEEHPEYKKHSCLIGTPISLAEAGRKYDIPQATISRWIRKYPIKILGSASNRRVLIDEADIAYYAGIYHRSPGSGRWTFNKDGTPYIKKN